MRKSLACAILLLAVTGFCHAAPVTRDYASFVRELIDLDGLPYLQDGVTCREWTSFDRAKYKDPYANGDCGQYIRTEPNGEAVMAEMNGPGCIVRLWSANPQGKIRFYFDGAKTPQYEFDFEKLFRGEIPPFKAPITYKQGDRQSASDCYLPIPYAVSCKVTADKAWGQYYHVWARTFPKDWKVPTFRLPLTAAEQAAVDEVCAVWTRTGQRPQAALPQARVLQRHAELQPGQPYALDMDRGPGIIQALKIKVDASERYALRKVWLEARWDDETIPSVAAPLDGLFGTGFQANDFKSLPAGIIDGQGYLYFPMPFRKSASLKLVNQGEKPMRIALELTWAKVQDLPANTSYFHAKWRREPAATTYDYPFLEAKGRGRVVGVSLNIDSPMEGWWGEGNEKMWVDGRNWDEIIGTGSEDYFGDAWGLHQFQQPFFGASYIQSTRTCAYRWHIVDNVPFEKSMKFTIENYPPFRPDYTSTCFWYAMPGATDFFTPDAAQYATRRPWGRSLYNTVEAEDIPGVTGKIISDVDLPTEFSHGLAVDFGPRAAGATIGPLKFTVPADDAYYPAVYVGTAQKPAPFDLTVDGQTLGHEPGDLAATGIARFSGVWLTKGEHEFTLRYTGEGSGVLDCLQFPGSPKPWDVAEAENSKIIGTSGPQTRIERARLQWGHGQQLAFDAVKPGDQMTLEMATGPRGIVGLSAVITQQSDYGDFQVFVGDKPIGKVISGYSPQPVTTRAGLGQIDTNATRQITVKVVGKNEKSTGYGVGIDYFTFAPVTVENAIEAEDLPVLAHEGGGVQPQVLGGSFSNGTQLWFTNAKPDGYVTLELDVPKAGKYELNVYYCTSWDYAIVQAYLDDQKIGEPVDNYSAGVEWRGKYSYGVFDLAAGKHQIKFQSAGRNEKSKGYFMGIDALQLIAR